MSDEETLDPFKRSSKISRKSLNLAAPTEEQKEDSISETVSILDESEKISGSESGSGKEELDSDFVPPKSIVEPVKSKYDLRSKIPIHKGTETKERGILDTSDFLDNSALGSPLKPEVAPFVEKIVPKLIKPIKMPIEIKNILNSLPILENNAKGLELFLSRSDLIFSTIPTTDDDLKKFFLSYVKSCTSAFVKLAIQDLGTYELVRAALVARLLPKKTLMQLNEEISKISQFSDETILNYSDRINKLSNAIIVLQKESNPDATKETLKVLLDLINNQALEIFTKGLRGDMKNWVMAKDYKTLSEAVTYAVSKEPQLVSVKTPVKTPENPKDVNSVQKCYKCGLAGHLANYCKYKPAQNRESSKPSGSKFYCNFCKRSGHTEDRCFAAKRAKDKPSCTYCGQNTHTSQNCMRSITDQPHNKAGNINHMSANDQTAKMLAQIIPELMGNLSMRYGNNSMNLPQGSRSYYDLPRVYQPNGYGINSDNFVPHPPGDLVRYGGNINHVQPFDNNLPVNSSSQHNSFNQYENMHRHVHKIPISSFELGPSRDAVQNTSYQVVGSPNHQQDGNQMKPSNSEN